MDEVGWEQSLFTVALLQKDRESFLLLVEAQGRFGWKADIMEHSCGDQGDLRTMFVALVELDNGYVLQELVATGFDGPYLAAQEKAKNAVQVFIADAAFRDGRIIEELLAMPSWRPVFLEIKPSSYEDNLVEYLFRRYVVKSEHERLKARMLRLLLQNSYTVDLAKAEKWGATPETLAALRAAGAK